MGSLVVALLLSADPQLSVGDTPVIPHAIELHRGDTIPFSGLCMPAEFAVATAKRIAGCEAKVVELENKSGVDWPLTLGIAGAAAVVVGVIASVVTWGVMSQKK